MTDKNIIEWERVKKLVDEFLEQRKATIEVYHYFPDHLTDFILKQLTLAESRGEEKARKEIHFQLGEIGMKCSSDGLAIGKFLFDLKQSQERG